MEQAVPPEIRRRLDSWNRLGIFFRFIHVALGLIGVVCPLVVASFADSISTLSLRGLSFAAAVAIAIFAAFEIGAAATRFREAWKLLNATCIEYELGIVDREALAKAYREGEVRIGQMKADPFQKPAGAVEVANTQADASR
jgi:hypothetical protein